MRLSVLLLLSIVSCLTLSSQNPDYVAVDQPFKEGQKVHLFGDQVRLRAAPNTQAEIIRILPINAPIVILEQTNRTHNDQGIATAWYKIQYEDQIGYTVGSLLALYRLQLDNYHYLFHLKKEADSIQIMCRFLRDGQLLQELPIDLGRFIDGYPYFEFRLTNNRGLPNIDQVLLIGGYAESCGVGNKEVYVFAQNDRLQVAFQAISGSDGGVIYQEEKLIFPADEGGIPNKIKYYQEVGEVLDDRTNWTKVEITSGAFSWENGQITPAIPNRR